MTLKLTDEQRQAIDRSDGPVPVEDEHTRRVYFLVDPTTLQTLQRDEDIAAIRDGIADMEAGRVISLDELDERMRARLGLPPKKR
jgi:predicted transcriptional regulator